MEREHDMSGERLARVLSHCATREQGMPERRTRFSKAKRAALGTWPEPDPVVEDAGPPEFLPLRNPSCRTGVFGPAVSVVKSRQSLKNMPDSRV